MAKVEEQFRAFRGRSANPNQEQPGFTIDVEFLGGLTETQKGMFKDAALRWSKVITGDLPRVKINGRRVDDILIRAQGKAIDGVGKVLGRAGPEKLRRGSALPALGSMTFDTADLAAMESDGRLGDVIIHEMGHCLGIGTLWGTLKLIRGAGGNDPVFTGPKAQQEYAALAGGAPRPVPVENDGGPGTRDGHWRDALFGNEMMTGFISSAGNPISRLTIAALADMGYVVDLSAADPYQMPAAGAVFRTRSALPHWEMDRPEPEMLPEEADEG